jgi:signal transduction histidine kinase
MVLGLAIAQHIVSPHQGSIEAHSEGDGAGATFVVRSPKLTESSQTPRSPR